MIVRDRKIAFIHIQKTGGTSIEAHFDSFGPMRPNVGLFQNINHFEDRRTMWGGRLTHMNIKQLRRQVNLAGYRVFTVVRNPYARLVSMAAWLGSKPWLHQCLNPGPFRRYARTGATLIPQCSYVDDTVKVFRLEDGLDKVMTWLGEDAQLERRMASVHRPWQWYYDKAHAACVYRMFRRDFDEFGYDPDSWRDVDCDEAPVLRPAGVCISRVS